MTEALTTVLDLIAIALVVTGAFLISVGLGVLASGLAAGLLSLLIERSRKPKPE